jgi:formylglycine-generating enzyme required for sulfatase activity
MVYVPAGEFWMGSTDEDIQAARAEEDWSDWSERFAAESPMHRFQVAAFWIDRTEVTNAQYRQCVDARACSPPRASSSRTRDAYYGDSTFNQYPVLYVSWFQARDYAAWVGGRLPTEAEWEYAARGPDGSRYPWGDGQAIALRGNFGGPNAPSDTTPVGSYKWGASWCGALDMAGNVWEWTSSLYADYPYFASDGREDPNADGDRVHRGGQFIASPLEARCACRGKAGPDLAGDDVGFRVVMDAD